MIMKNESCEQTKNRKIVQLVNRKSELSALVLSKYYINHVHIILSKPSSTSTLPNLSCG